MLTRGHSTLVRNNLNNIVQSQALYNTDRHTYLQQIIVDLETLITLSL